MPEPTEQTPQTPQTAGAAGRLERERNIRPRLLYLHSGGHFFGDRSLQPKREGAFPLLAIHLSDDRRGCGGRLLEDLDPHSVSVDHKPHFSDHLVGVLRTLARHSDQCTEWQNVQSADHRRFRSQAGRDLTKPHSLGAGLSAACRGRICCAILTGFCAADRGASSSAWPAPWAGAFPSAGCPLRQAKTEAAVPGGGCDRV